MERMSVAKQLPEQCLDCHPAMSSKPSLKTEKTIGRMMSADVLASN